jgi:hypothetical protein
MKNTVIWDVTPWGSCKNQRFKVTYPAHFRVTRIGHVVRVASYVVPSSPILVTLMMEAILSSGMSVLTRTTRRNIPADGILQHFSSSQRPKLSHIRSTFPTVCLASAHFTVGHRKLTQCRQEGCVLTFIALERAEWFQTSRRSRSCE